MTDAEVLQLWNDSYQVALNEAGFGIGNGDVAHMNQPLVFYRAILAMQSGGVCDECSRKASDGWVLYCMDCLSPLFDEAKL